MNFSSNQHDWRLTDFDYHLPLGQIAAEPAVPRDSARLLHVRADGLGDYHVYDLPYLLRSDDLLVMNNTKVIPARLFGKRGQCRVEIFLHKKTGPQRWLALARPLKRLKEGDEVIFAPGFSAIVQKKTDKGEIIVRFSCADDALFSLLELHGHVPLPPYIIRPHGDTEADRTSYQTIFASKEGAVAAPTAGLHFTPELFRSLNEKGIENVMLTLHVGAGTFLPVKTERVADHIMHSEWGEITPETACTINAARKAGRRIVAVGTTVLRLLETVADETGMVRPFSGETSLFILPGYKFKTVDALLTNFHLPKSTLFMLAAAFSGLEGIRSAYSHAIQRGYRFYSYGDATLLERRI